MKNQNKPWLDEKGNPLSTEVLKEVSGNWTEETWENYLLTLEVERSGEQLLSTKEYLDRCEREDSIFEYSSQHASEELKDLIQEILAKLTKKQKEVIKKYYFKGLSEREIAAQLETTPSNIHELKKKGLSQIKLHLNEKPSVSSLMKGQDKSHKDIFDRIEDLYWEDRVSDDEFYRLWALAQVGGLKVGDLL